MAKGVYRFQKYNLSGEPVISRQSKQYVFENFRLDELVQIARLLYRREGDAVATRWLLINE